MGFPDRAMGEIKFRVLSVCVALHNFSGGLAFLGWPALLLFREIIRGLDSGVIIKLRNGLAGRALAAAFRRSC